MRAEINFSTWRALRFSFAWAEVKKKLLFCCKVVQIRPHCGIIILLVGMVPSRS